MKNKLSFFILFTVLCLPIFSFAQNDDLPTTGDTGIFCPQISQRLNLGISDISTLPNGQITQLQHFLSDYYDLPNFITGYFGRNTKNKILQFQTEQNIIPTGIVGTVTKNKILQVCGNNNNIQQIVPIQPVATSTTQTNLDCNFDNKILKNKHSILAYQTSTVDHGENCTFEFRTCSGGNLSGSNPFSACHILPQTCAAGTPQTQNISCPSGQTGTIVQQRNSVCSSQYASPTWSDWTQISNTCVTPAPVPVVTVSTNIWQCTNNFLVDPKTNWACGLDPRSKIIAYPSWCRCADNTKTCSYNGTTYQEGQTYTEPNTNIRAGIMCALPCGGGAQYKCTNGSWVYIPGSGQPFVAAKPVIYLYPTKKKEVKVKLNYAGVLTTTYPEYDKNISGWDVIAKPDGTLKNLADNKEYSYLFWEGKNYPLKVDESTGFVIKGSDTKNFLQTKLAQLGLTPKEYNEFIVYWLPKMENNNYNFIQFVGDDYTKIAPLTIIPKPDSILRVFMAFRPLDNPEQVKEQKINSFVRKGFSVIEWGGMEMGE